jgi:serine/threonine protein kinase
VRVGYNKNNKNQAYAVKIIDKSRLRTRKAQHDLQNEIELLTVLQSPNIVTMKAVTKEDEDYYIAMEMCNGGDLRKMLEAKGFLNEVDARKIII